MRGSLSYEMTSTCGLRPIGGGYQPPMMMEPSSPASAWQFHSVIPRNDSGIASGSDFVSSLLVATIAKLQHSIFIADDHPDGSSSPPSTALYSTPVIRSNVGYQMSSTPMPLYPNDHNPLTPPTVDSTASPVSVKGDRTLTPRGSP
nr:unnamed protein product [Callosobruchus chinensis]